MRLSKLHRKLNTFLGELKAKFSKKELTKKSDLPFFPQIASIELIEGIFTNKFKPENDPKWRESGAANIEEYKKWHHQMCGMACLQMILFDKFQTTPPIVTLAKNCQKYGGYKEKYNDMDGLFYKPFCKYVKKEFNLNAKVAENMSLDRIKHEFCSGNYVIVSVHPSIRHIGKVEEPIKKGGHLVLVTGYDDIEGKIYINNPSGFSEDTRKNHKIRYKDFEKFYARRGIIVEN